MSDDINRRIRTLQRAIIASEQRIAASPDDRVIAAVVKDCTPLIRVQAQLVTARTLSRLKSRFEEGFR